MKSNSAIAALFSGVCLAASGFAQVAPDTGTDPADAAPPPPLTAGQLSKVSFLRVWYFGAPQSPRITVVSRSLSGKPHVLGSHIRPDRMLSYRAMDPGSYRLEILDGKIIPDETGAISSDRPLIPPAGMELKGGVFGTILVRNENGKLSVRYLEDKPPASEGGPIVRVFSFTDTAEGSVHLTSGGRNSRIWDSKMATPVTLDGTVAPGPACFQFFGKVEDEQRQLSSCMADLSRDTACSVVIFQDRYGNNTMALVEDARTNLTAGELKQLAQSPQ